MHRARHRRLARGTSSNSARQAIPPAVYSLAVMGPLPGGATWPKNESHAPSENAPKAPYHADEAHHPPIVGHAYKDARPSGVVRYTSDITG